MDKHSVSIRHELEVSNPHLSLPSHPTPVVARLGMRLAWCQTESNPDWSNPTDQPTDWNCTHAIRAANFVYFKLDGIDPLTEKNQIDFFCNAFYGRVVSAAIFSGVYLFIYILQFIFIWSSVVLSLSLSLSLSLCFG